MRNETHNVAADFRNVRKRTGWRRMVLSIAGAALLALEAGCAASLLNASAAGDTQKVLLLLQEGHHVDEAVPLIGTRPLMLAAAYGHVETIKALLDAGADVNAQDVTGWTPLHAGAYKGDAAVVSLLLAHGARVASSRWYLRTPAEIAEMLDHKDVLPVLREAEQKVNQSSPRQ